MPKATTARSGNFISRFVSETVGELRKVTWPTRDEALRLTAIVIAVLFGSSLFLGLIDMLLTELFRVLLT
jgi:preprotein translocase subunit SecE